MQALKTDFRTAPLAPRQYAICVYVEKLTLTPELMIQSDLQPLREVGLDDTQILETVQICGYFNYINRVAHALGVPDEPEWSRPTPSSNGHAPR